MEEVWKPVEGYGGRYQISSLGRFKRVPFRMEKPYMGRSYMIDFKEKQLKLSESRTGYLRVYITYNKRMSKPLVHKLVGKAFLTKTPERNCINHKDKNRQNNRVENLEWCTYKENAFHRDNKCGTI